MRGTKRRVDESSASISCKFWTRTHRSYLLRGGLDTAIEGCANYPCSSYDATTAGKHWTSWRRYHGPERPCFDSGINGHTNTLRSPVWLYATTSSTTYGETEHSRRSDAPSREKHNKQIHIATNTGWIYRSSRAETGLVVSSSSLHPQLAHSMVWRGLP